MRLKMANDESIRVTQGYLREMITSACVKAEHLDRTGGDSTLPRVVMRTCAVTLCLLDNLDGAEGSRLIENANHRAKRIFAQGEDWRRELKLYETLQQYLNLPLTVL
jgi:hypothetical protein